MLLEAEFHMTDPVQIDQTRAALQAGYDFYPPEMGGTSYDAPPALVPLIGRCDKIDPMTMSVDFVLFSNVTPDETGTISSSSQPEQFFLPWTAGQWYDLPVVMPQNMSVDISNYFPGFHVAIIILTFSSKQVIMLGGTCLSFVLFSPFPIII